MKILMMGNPNVGKSALFSRITGVEVACSNYPGTTVAYCSGKLLIGGNDAELIDVPGTYSLTHQNPAEEVATKMMDAADTIINVIDSTNLERNLFLTLQVIDAGKPVIVALNMVDEARHLGVTVDDKKLSEILGVPVVRTVAVTGEGVKELVEEIPKSKANPKRRDDQKRWDEIGELIGKAQTLTERKHTLWDRIEDATIKPATGLPIAVIVLYITFTAIIGVGNWFIENVMDPLFYNIYGPFIHSTVGKIVPDGIVRSILLGSGEDFVESLGALTTGVYVPLDMVLPFVVLFYFMLSLLEDVGYLPRLATLMDNLMHRIGLHGSAIVPAVLGLGCNVPGMLATRILETKKQRFIAATLMAICIPCLAQNAVIIGLLLPYGIQYLATVYATLLIVYIILGLALNRIIKGESPEILLEIPPYRMPNLKTLLKKTWIRVRYFLTDAVPYVIAGVIFVNILYVTGFVGFVGEIMGPLMNNLFGLPQEAVLALIVGFLRKDIAVGMLAPLGLTAAQLTVAATVLAMYFPCVATFTVLYRELGLKDMIKSVALMFTVTAATGFALKTILL